MHESVLQLSPSVPTFCSMLWGRAAFTQKHDSSTLSEHLETCYNARWPLVTCMCMCFKVSISDIRNVLANQCCVSLRESFLLLLQNSSMLFGLFNKEVFLFSQPCIVDAGT